MAVNMEITFLGAAQTVTGSKYLLQIGKKTLLIDCGLYQGLKELRLRNWQKFPINPKEIDAILLTHAHIDHSGYIPLLVKNGYRGPIYATSGTHDLCKILLPDSGHLQEEEAEFANRYKYSKHFPALPLYTKQDAIDSLDYFKRVNFNKLLKLDNETTIIYRKAGHIVGAAMIEIHHQGQCITFTGDLGRLNDPVMFPPEQIEKTDYLVIESTYGNRLHEPTHPMDNLEKIINKTVNRGGSVIIPTFAVGRSQSIMYYLSELKKAGRIPDIPVYLDSPMAINATKVFAQHVDEHRLSKHECKATCMVAKYINTVEDSKQIDKGHSPRIIISANGMATGGRILFHLQVFGPDPKNTILFTGFQATGTRGARLLNGEKSIKIHGQYVDINAEVVFLSNTSAHADAGEILLWLESIKQPPKKIFITHGELDAASALKIQIEKKFGWSCMTPQYLDKEILQ